VNYALRYKIPQSQLPSQAPEVERLWKVYEDTDLARDDLLYLQSEGCICRIEKTREPVEDLDGVEGCEGM